MAERPFSWHRRADLRVRLGEVTRSDTGRAAGLASATIASNVLALLFTIVFARILGASGYGSLAVLISAYIILMVPGSSLQIAAAREVSHDLAAGSPDAGAGVRRWLTRLVLATAAVAVLAIPLRSPIAALVNVDQLWGAAAIPVTAMLWMVLSVERGTLQGFQQYRTVGLSIVGEATTRMVFGLALAGIGPDVTGAFLGSAASLIAMAAVLTIPLRRRLPPAERTVRVKASLRALLRGAWVPVAGLTLILLLQELPVIIVKHEASDDAAGSYAAAAVAAKAIIWVAIGLGMFLLPETTRRWKTGGDARPILLRTIGLIAAAGVPMVLIYAVAGEPLLRLAFGDDLTDASAALPWLGLAMTMLACAYLSVQFLLAMHRAVFIWVLGVAAVAELLLLIVIGADLTAVAIALFCVHASAAVTLLAISLRIGVAVEPAPPAAQAQPRQGGSPRDHSSIGSTASL